jgi:lauroyl/myristoyl acyltransferase
MMTFQDIAATPRRLLRWKTLFYDALLPVLSRLGPAASARVLAALGGASAALWPPRKAELRRAIATARRSLGADWNEAETTAELAARIPRFLARDFPLDRLDDRSVFDRFDVAGYAKVQEAIDQGTGVILVGGHFGAHLAAIHWLYRAGTPLRLLVQRPNHVSQYLHNQFDLDQPIPQSQFFLRRGLGAAESAERVLNARRALRAGMAVYMAGDIPWKSPNARRGTLMGRTDTFLSVWADLAVLTRAPVVPVFCSHENRGRFLLTFDPPWTLKPGDEPAAVERFLARLEAEIDATPADAVAHLLWSCYQPTFDKSIISIENRKPIPIQSANDHVKAAAQTAPIAAQ